MGLWQVGSRLPSLQASARAQIPSYRMSSLLLGLDTLNLGRKPSTLLGGSGDLVTRVINRATILIITYHPNYGTYNLTC